VRLVGKKNLQNAWSSVKDVFTESWIPFAAHGRVGAGIIEPGVEDLRGYVGCALL